MTLQDCYDLAEARYRIRRLAWAMDEEALWEDAPDRYEEAERLLAGESREASHAR